MVFLSQKVDRNIIFTDYWKVLGLIFSGMGNTVFSWAKKLLKRWYLLITEKVLFWISRWWEIWSFLSQEIDGKMIFTGYWEVLALDFSVMGNTVFFQPKRWWKDDIKWSFWAFYDIPGCGKYGFSRSVKHYVIKHLILLKIQNMIDINVHLFHCFTNFW